MNILFLTTILPRQQRMGSEVASQCFIDALRHSGHSVTVVGYMRKDDPFELDSSEVLVDRRYIETKRAKGDALRWLLLSFVRGLPYSAMKYCSEAYVHMVKALLSQQHYDLAIIDHPQLGWLQAALSDLPQSVMLAHNIEHEIYQQHCDSENPLARWIYSREASLIKTWEDQLAMAVDQVWTLTEYDAKYFASLVGVQAQAMTLPANLSEVQPPLETQKSYDIGLIGSWAWKPNEEGLRWFLEAVYPHLPPELTIHIAGRGADWLSARYPNMRYPNIQYRGFVESAHTFMAAAKVVAIPTLSGGGIQIKTLDAITSGSMIVATSIALRGITDLPETVQVADQPHVFAEALLAAIHNATATSFSAADWCRERQKRFLTEIQKSLERLC